jgi:hypothetical protein
MAAEGGGIACIQLVYPSTVRLRAACTPSGRAAKHKLPNQPPCPAAAMLATQRWHRITWRTGTKGPLSPSSCHSIRHSRMGPLASLARFAAVRVHVADGPLNAEGTRLPGEAVWLSGEWHDSGETKYSLSNRPKRTSLRRLVATDTSFQDGTGLSDPPGLPGPLRAAVRRGRQLPQDMIFLGDP